MSTTSSEYNSSEYNSSEYNSSENNSSEYSDYDDYKENYNLEGELLNKYNIICEIGRGAFSIVWLGYNISNEKFYAIKVQNYTDYDDGIDEVEALKKIKHNSGYLNTMVEYFIEKRIMDKKTRRSVCSVYELCCGNIDKLARKGNYQNGYPREVVDVIYKQLVIAINDLHYKNRMFHGDIKPDNILLCGLNNYDKKIIDMYNSYNFNSTYSEVKKKYWLEKGKELKNIKKMKPETKLRIREEIHRNIVFDILSNDINESKYEFDPEYLKPENLKIKLTDFGSYCPDDEFFEEPFGTTYYQAPEMIFMDKCKKKVDVWALGCTIYELLTGKILFDPGDDMDSETENKVQLEMMVEFCGGYDYKMFHRGQFYKKYRLNNYKRSNKLTIFEQLKEKVGEHYASILQNMLVISPGQRSEIKTFT
jgi:serine/threonine protein kinase